LEMSDPKQPKTNQWRSFNELEQMGGLDKLN